MIIKEIPYNFKINLNEWNKLEKIFYGIIIKMN